MFFEKKTEKQNELESLKLANQNLNVKIDSLKKELKNLEEKINNLNLKIESQNLLLNALEKEKLSLSYENDKLKRLNQSLNKILENVDDPEIHKNLDIIRTGEYFKTINNNITINSKTNELIMNENIKDIDAKDFYDVIISINSIKDITKGWEVKMSKRAIESYEKLKKETIIKIGVIGNSNKGKSFILSKISKIKLPSGTSIRTEGLSIKYPELKEYKERKIVLLDSAGLETPVLNEEEGENKEEDMNAKKEESETETETDNIKEDTKSIKEETEKEDSKEKDVNDEKNQKEIFKEKSREKMITELFLQNYIINNSDILIIVVDILTYSEQKLINRIKSDIRRAKINKPLYIIHNLKTYTSVKQVEDYINNILLKSVTFKLEKKEAITTKKESKTGAVYYEKNCQPQIYHLLFANEGSEAGRYYNRYTLDFLENTYQNITDLKPFDVIDTVKKRFKEISPEIIEQKEETIIFDKSNKELIKLNQPEKIVLKKCLIDELGFSNLKSNGFEPTYNYFQKDDSIIIRVEAPGNCNMKYSIENIGEYNIIKLYGNKKKDKEPEKLSDNIYNCREFGDYSVNIPLKIEDYLIKNKEYNIDKKNGIFFLEVEIDKKKNTGGYEMNEGEEI